MRTVDRGREREHMGMSEWRRGNRQDPLRRRRVEETQEGRVMSRVTICCELQGSDGGRGGGGSSSWVAQLD